jgi:hypothetical protein
MPLAYFSWRRKSTASGTLTSPHLSLESTKYFENRQLERKLIINDMRLIFPLELKKIFLLMDAALTISVSYLKML